MKKTSILTIMLVFTVAVMTAQTDSLYIFDKQGNIVYREAVAKIDSIDFSGDFAESDYYKNYQGTPYTNATYHPVPGHPIPGKVMLAYFDAGGEGISWHDTSKGNTGGFRNETDVDAKATNGGDGDKPTLQPYTDPAPPVVPMGLHYLGWTATGEWVNLTVDIMETGTYEVDLFYSANGQGSRIAVAIDGVDVLTNVTLRTTGYYHQWYECPIGEVQLQKGRRVLTFKETNVNGNNFAFLTFKLKQ